MTEGFPTVRQAVQDRQSLLSALRDYKTNFDEEREFISRFIVLLQHPDSYERTHLPGHITASSWIINKEGSKVLLVKHAALKKWLQPGGHADGDENVFRVAVREANEETGLTNLIPVGSGFLDIDIHLIPARKDLSFPEHDHYDVRFLFQADETDELKISEESTDLRWIELKDLEKFNPEISILRLRSKL
ncbi:MAG TPA: NUDIX hydrolase [Cyclobacteriaceae bacterium]|nr:NUDIX hydrolase [Cyclobacteriaceae bacterium]